MQRWLELGRLLSVLMAAPAADLVVSGPSGAEGVIQVTVTASLIHAAGTQSFSAVLDRRRSVPVPANGSAAFTDVVGGPHSVRLVVPPHCLLDGLDRATNPVAVAVPSHGTATVRFLVLCIS